jgi:protoheme IX farnesyltransferase
MYGALLGLAGVVTLFIFTNFLAFLSALIGWVVYLLLYTPLKRITGYSLFVGAVSGALPPVVGYVAVTARFDLAVIGIFAFMFVWQMAHFVAIALYRYDEYTTARIPLLVSRPSETVRKYARKSFYLSLIVLLVWCITLILQR